MEKKNNIINVINEYGETIECRVLFTVEDDKTNKNYIVYTNDEVMENGDIKTYASIYNPESDFDTIDLIPIKNKSDWEFIEKVLNSLQKEEEDKNE